MLINEAPSLHSLTLILHHVLSFAILKFVLRCFTIVAGSYGHACLWSKVKLEHMEVHGLKCEKGAVAPKLKHVFLILCFLLLQIILVESNETPRVTKVLGRFAPWAQAACKDDSVLAVLQPEATRQCPTLSLWRLHKGNILLKDALSKILDLDTVFLSLPQRWLQYE